jgi:hypothetical protein
MQKMWCFSRLTSISSYPHTSNHLNARARCGWAPPAHFFRLRLELRTYYRTLGPRSLEAGVAAESALALIGSSRAINRAISAKPSSNGAAAGWGGSGRYMNRLKLGNIFIAASSVQTALGRQGCWVFVSNLSKIRKVRNRVKYFPKGVRGSKKARVRVVKDPPSTYAEDCRLRCVKARNDGCGSIRVAPTDIVGSCNC